jgi:hypothetical protein
MVIYTYTVLEEHLEALWGWLHHVEHWSNQSFAEFGFDSHAKESHRVWKATAKNRVNLYQRLQVEQPWSILNLAWPAGTLRSSPFRMKGMDVAVVSRPQPRRGSESYRVPSCLYVEVHPTVLVHSTTGVSGFLSLGIQAWQIVEGVYGFIDIETGIPLADDISRNAIHLFESTVPPEHHQEFRKWQDLMPHLDKRVWKAFWGNFLGAEHLRQLGGIQEMRRADPRYRLLPEYLEKAYQQGVERLQACSCVSEWFDLANSGVLMTLSSSPLDWFAPEVRMRQDRLQETLGELALGPWDFRD